MTVGLFSIVNRNNRLHSKLDVRAQLQDGGNIRFWGPEALTGLDLVVLQALVARAGKYGRWLKKPSTNPTIEAIRYKLSNSLEEVATKVENADKIFVQASYAQLASEIGMDTDTNRMYYSTLRKSIERLYAVTITLDNGNMRLSTRMISTAVLGGQKASLVVVLNGFISRAIIGGNLTNHVPFAHIPMEEVRKLKGDAARILHQHLCAMVFPGGDVRKFSLDTLVGYVFPPDPGITPRTERKHRTAIRIALDEIERTGWHISVSKEGVYSIQRDPIRGQQPRALALRAER